MSQNKHLLQVHLALVFLIFICGFIPNKVLGQDKVIFEIGPELQVYPAGFMTNVRADFQLSELLTLNTRVGYNFARRQDFGEHDNEEGGGPGLIVGAKRYFNEGYAGLFVGGRVDLWFMGIDWRDDLANNAIREGSTDIIVVQPVAEFGYTFVLPCGKWSISPAVAAGVEINIKSEGEDVGEGGIWLGSVHVAYRF